MTLFTARGSSKCPLQTSLHDSLILQRCSLDMCDSAIPNNRPPCAEPASWSSLCQWILSKIREQAHPPCFLSPTDGLGRKTNMIGNFIKAKLLIRWNLPTCHSIAQSFKKPALMPELRILKTLGRDNRQLEPFGLQDTETQP